MSDTDDVDTVDASRRSTSAYLQNLLVAVLVVCTGVIGWWMRGRVDDGFVEVSRPTIDEVVELIGLVGVRCEIPLDTSVRPHDGSSMSICRSMPRFSLSIHDDALGSYRSFDLATHVGCFRVGAVPPTRWYVAHRDTWNLLTHDHATAERLTRLMGVTLATGRCDVPNPDRVE